ncbi:MAG TPA: hypothetical protein DEP01_05950 [Aminobacterium sp.]|jgi:hypothetical protein|uniref:hypothetical protein n=2 Tax=Aminobacteriaceae TaxID=3029087 RepID=UPI000464EE2C|nr:MULTISPECIES: hypothetical protein [Aminobacterium]HCA41066.1 hypothetical protein [Aminobacterium sp.]
METETLSIAQCTHKLLQEYMEIQEDLFKPSLRKVIPIPGIFCPVDYKETCGRLGDICRQLAEVREKIRELRPDNKTIDGQFLILQRAYISGMMEAVFFLKEISQRLYERSCGAKEYSRVQYKEDMEIFKEKEISFLKIGLKLNNMIHNR